MKLNPRTPEFWISLIIIFCLVMAAIAIADIVMNGEPNPDANAEREHA